MKPSHATGFTLIEVMIVVVIVGILAAVAFPAYQQHIQASRRADAQGALVSLAATMERAFTQQNSYAPAPVLPATVPLDGGAATYNLNVVVTATTYTLTATPVGPQAGDGILTLTNTGARTWGANNNWER